jgi:hypothetical protein
LTDVFWLTLVLLDMTTHFLARVPQLFGKEPVTVSSLSDFSVLLCVVGIDEGLEFGFIESIVSVNVLFCSTSGLRVEIEDSMRSGLRFALDCAIDSGTSSLISAFNQ